MSKSQLRSTSFFSATTTTTVSISLVLFLLGLTILIAIVGREISSFMKENVGLSIELPENMSDASITKLQKELNSSQFVRAAIFVSKDEIKEQLIEDLGRDPEEILGYNPLYNSFEIKLNPEYANPDSLKVAEKQLRSKNAIKNFIYNKDDIEMVNANLSKIGAALFVVYLVYTNSKYDTFEYIFETFSYQYNEACGSNKHVYQKTVCVENCCLWNRCGNTCKHCYNGFALLSHKRISRTYNHREDGKFDYPLRPNLDIGNSDYGYCNNIGR